MWAIGYDSRGVHTWFTEPSGSQLIYYHKPIDTDFNNDVMKAEIYINTKLREKQRKGYVATNANRFNAAKCSFYKI